MDTEHDRPGSVFLRIGHLTRDDGSRAEVELALSRRAFPVEPSDAFLPLRIPEECRVILRGPLLRQGVRQIAGNLRLSFNPGSYHVCLGAGDPCRIELGPRARADVDFEAGPGPDGQGPVLGAFDLRFTPPLAIHNLLQTLQQIHELVDDHLLAPFKPLRSLLPGWIRGLGQRAVDSTDATAVILLEHATGRPTSGPVPGLRMHFSGRVRWLDRIDVPFDSVRLPGVVLPVPHAALEQLLSDEPLATARMSGELPEPWEQARTLFQTLRRIEGEVDAEVTPPPITLRGHSLDGTELSVTARMNGIVGIRSTLIAEVQPPPGRQGPVSLDVTLGDLHLTSGDGVDGLTANVSSNVQLDLDPPRPDQPRRSLKDRLLISAAAEIAEGGHLPDLQLDLRASEGLTRAETHIPLTFEQLKLSGGVELAVDAEGAIITPVSALSLDGQISQSQSEQAEMETRSHRPGGGDLRGRLQPGRFVAGLSPCPDGRWQAALQLNAQLGATLCTHITGLPELNLDDGDFEAWIDGVLGLELNAEIEPTLPRFCVDLSGSRFSWRTVRADFELDGRRVALPPETAISGNLLHGAVRASGLDRMVLDLRWDMQGQPCLLRYEQRAISLLSPDLRLGNLVVQLDEAGKLSFSGHKEGLYGVRFFNLLLNPAGDPTYLQELLRSDDAVTHVAAALEAFNPVLAEALTDVQALWRAAQIILRREGIVEPGDLIPRQNMARIMSLLLTGSDRLQGRLVPIIKRVTEGGGVDRAAARELLHRELGEFDIDHVISFIVNWLDLVLSPVELQTPAPVVTEPPLVVGQALDEQRAGLPNAAEIYERVCQDEIDPDFARTLCDLAPRLTLSQLSFIIARISCSLDSGHDQAVLARLRQVHAIKERVEQVDRGYGGVAYALQPLMIGTFLGEAVGPIPGVNASLADGETWPPPCALGPRDVAVLLTAGLAARKQDRRTQRNNGLLLRLLQEQPASFTREVLVELGLEGPRALAGILYAFFAQDQDQLAEPVDPVALLEQKLGCSVPRQSDFLAGGRKARESYYEALCGLADRIIEQAAPFLARKHYLNVVRGPSPRPVSVPAGSAVERLERRAKESIARADAMGDQCCFDGEGQRTGPRARSRQAYQRAFQACAKLLTVEPRAFQLPWLKHFWLRNEEALTVLSVVRNYQQDIDDVRRWLAVQSGRQAFSDEQELLRAVVDTCYLKPEHRQALLDDPLVRLLIDPDPQARYVFTIISAMGVITEGASGTELERAYARLEQQRGIRIIRAHTATARSLEYNAARIIEAIERSETPYGLIGYSQGCTNALMAESSLLGGTPDQAKLLEGLVCRNLLFSAANGSVHGTCGLIKFRRAMALGERYLKHYQALYSREAVASVLGAFKGILDAKPFVASLGGVNSLTFERARALHRDEQFLDRVPTSYTRGVVAEQDLPEVLEFMYHMLREQTDGPDGRQQDTQVTLTDAVGHSTSVRNDYTEVLERCDMGSYPQATHHWAPLHREVAFITTERDRRRAVYMSPKDRLVWPWVEVNARFGRIAVE